MTVERLAASQRYSPACSLRGSGNSSGVPALTVPSVTPIAEIGYRPGASTYAGNPALAALSRSEKAASEGVLNVASARCTCRAINRATSIDVGRDHEMRGPFDGCKRRFAQTFAEEPVDALHGGVTFAAPDDQRRDPALRKRRRRQREIKRGFPIEHVDRRRLPWHRREPAAARRQRYRRRRKIDHRLDRFRRCRPGRRRNSSRSSVECAVCAGLLRSSRQHHHAAGASTIVRLARLAGPRSATASATRPPNEWPTRWTRAARFSNDRFERARLHAKSRHRRRPPLRRFAIAGQTGGDAAKPVIPGGDNRPPRRSGAA